MKQNVQTLVECSAGCHWRFAFITLFELKLLLLVIVKHLVKTELKSKSYKQKAYMKLG